MKNVRSHFSTDELSAMEKISVVLSDEHDYTDDELLDISDKITQNLPCDFDKRGEPEKSGRIFESIVDKFYDNFGI